MIRYPKILKLFSSQQYFETLKKKIIAVLTNQTIN